MENLTEILLRARERAEKMKLPYAGALTPHEAHAVLLGLPGARIVDVRTRAELDWVGRIPGAIEIEWNTYPGGVPNAQFVALLQQQVEALQAPLLFICRSGARSHNAAIAAVTAGMQDCYNVLEGFEGDRNADGQRGRLGGWRHAGLPWQQS
ncbi:rhodanese-like domain-containing protein [Uliginosibacterium flavum]|uniref:Rhodanese-like domain-containing protein n=1 Tax=Uliginosibacterium flavum TaxID=1396831 RepID=A0ABV2TRX6_9RHOO